MHILYSCNNLFATSHLSLAKPSPNLSSLNLGKPNSNLAFSHRFWFHPILTSLRPISLATIYPNLATPSPNLAITIYFGYTLPSWLSPSLFGYIPSQLGHSLYQLGHTHSNVATPVPYLATPHLCLAVWFYLAIWTWLHPISIGTWTAAQVPLFSWREVCPWTATQVPLFACCEGSPWTAAQVPLCAWRKVCPWAAVADKSTPRATSGKTGSQFSPEIFIRHTHYCKRSFSLGLIVFNQQWAPKIQH